MTLFECIPAEISAIIMSSVGDIVLVIMVHTCQTWKTIVKKSLSNHLISKNKFIENVVKMGYLNIVKWARENRCPWDSQTCSNAALGGHLEVLKWARENQCPWNNLTCYNAALGGH